MNEKQEFPYSAVVDSEGRLLPVFHGTKREFSEFSATMTVDGGFHFGTADQAKMRTYGREEKRLIEAVLNIRKPRRLKDPGGGWKAKIQSAKRAGFDGIVYLNRYEGVSNESLSGAISKGLDIDKLSDAQFRSHFPEASDSWIAFDQAQIRTRSVVIVSPTPRPSAGSGVDVGADVLPSASRPKKLSM